MKFLYGLLSFFSRTANLVAFILLVLAGAAAWINPELFWPLGLLGLAYPYIALINVFFVISWILRKRFFFIFSLLGLVLTYPQLKAQIAWPIFQKKSTESANLKVMTYNVRNFDLYNWTKNNSSRKSMMDSISAYQPDVIMFQEYYTDSNKFNNDHALDSLGYKYHQKAIELVKNSNRIWGVAIFSKYPIEESGEFIRQQMPSAYGNFNNRGVYADISVQNQKIRMVAVHLQSIYLNNEDFNNIENIKEETTHAYKKIIPIVKKLGKAFVQRGIQAAELKAFIEESPYPVILGGDFNDTPGSYAYQHVVRGMKDTFLEKGKRLGSTYNGKIPFLRIDHIMTDSSFETINFHIIRNPNSDHFPIMAEIYIPSIN